MSAAQEQSIGLEPPDAGSRQRASRGLSVRWLVMGSSPEQMRHRGHMWEVVAVVAAGGILVVAGSGLDSPGKSWLFSASVFLCVLGAAAAYLCAAGAADAEQKSADEVKFRVTDRRLATLEAVGVDRDVRDALAHLKGEELTAGQLSDRLAGSDIDLPLARFDEFKDKILKYTKVEPSR